MTLIVRKPGSGVDTISRGDKIIIDQNEYQNLADSKSLDSVKGIKRRNQN